MHYFELRIDSPWLKAQLFQQVGEISWSRIQAAHRPHNPKVRGSNPLYLCILSGYKYLSYISVIPMLDDSIDILNDPQKHVFLIISCRWPPNGVMSSKENQNNRTSYPPLDNFSMFWLIKLTSQSYLLPLKIEPFIEMQIKLRYRIIREI